MRHCMIALMALVTFAGAYAQWSVDPANPNLIAGFNGEQVMPKVAVTPDGTSYICRFDNALGGYRVFLQKLSREGNLLWTPAEGVSVSSQPQMTWLTEYDIDADQDGNAVIVFQDIRNSGVNNVVIYKVNADGSLAWSPDGISLSSDTNTDYGNMSPVVFNSADNSSYAAWQRMGPNSTTITVQRVSPAGQKLWGENGYTLESAAGSCTWPQIVQADGNNILLKYYIDSGPFWAPTRHVYIAKYNPEGQQLWNTLISDAGGISAWQQLISFVEDGFGGAAIAWYDDRDSNQINDVYAQHVTSDGAVTMPANGALITMDASNQQYYPDLAVDAEHQHIYAFYKVTNAGQTQDGMGRQLLDFNGNRQWGDNGVMMVNLSQYVASPVIAYMTVAGAVCVYSMGTVPASDMSLDLRASCFRSSGASGWVEEYCDVATTPTNKYHYNWGRNPEGWVVLAWEEGLSSMDIYAMRINADGSLGMQYPAPRSIEAEFIPPDQALVSWQQPSPYFAPESYYVYINGELGQSVPAAQTTCQFNNLTPGNYWFYVKAYYGDGHYSACSDTAYIDVVDNCDPFAPSPPLSLSAYPNPFAERLSISLKGHANLPVRVELYNLKGQLITRKIAVSGVELSLETNKLPSGIYLLDATQGGDTIRRKLVKVR